ncbi:hypothetical protein Dimus_038501 [Dionaea muscipula]
MHTRPARRGGGARLATVTWRGGESEIQQRVDLDRRDRRVGAQIRRDMECHTSQYEDENMQVELQQPSGAATHVLLRGDDEDDVMTIAYNEHLQIFNFGSFC